MGRETPIPVDLPSIVDAFVHDDPGCPLCLGAGIVCEDHPEKAWLDGTCCGGAGMPCSRITAARAAMASG